MKMCRFVIADQLKRRGIEAVTVRDLGLLGIADVNHLVRATGMGYVLGIVLGQQKRHWIGEWVKGLEIMHAVYTAENMQNRVEYL